MGCTMVCQWWRGVNDDGGLAAMSGLQLARGRGEICVLPLIEMMREAEVCECDSVCVRVQTRAERRIVEFGSWMPRATGRYLTPRPPTWGGRMDACAHWMRFTMGSRY